MVIKSNEFLLVDEIATECRAPRASVRHWIATGKLASVKVGRRRLVRRQDFERFLRSAGLRDAPGAGQADGGSVRR